MTDLTKLALAFGAGALSSTAVFAIVLLVRAYCRQQRELRAAVRLMGEASEVIRATTTRRRS